MVTPKNAPLEAQRFGPKVESENTPSTTLFNHFDNGSKKEESPLI
jgi:hypothetical protein